MVREGQVGRPPQRVITPGRVAREEQSAKWCEEHLTQGVTYQAIAERDGVGAQTVSHRVRNYMRRYHREKAAGVRAVVNAQLQALIDANWEAAIHGNSRAGNLVLKCLIEKARLFGAYEQPDSQLVQQVNQILITYASQDGRDWRTEKAIEGEEVPTSVLVDRGEGESA